MEFGPVLYVGKRRDKKLKWNPFLPRRPVASAKQEIGLWGQSDRQREKRATKGTFNHHLCKPRTMMWALNYALALHQSSSSPRVPMKSSSIRFADVEEANKK